MIRIADPAEMRAWTRTAKRDGARIGFVPTMGAIHEGHLRLVDIAARQSDHVIASVFVNPLQFGPREDLARYPRDLAGDAAKLRRRHVQCLFAPSTATMYPAEMEVRVTPGTMADTLCGPFRPGHFAGVLTAVAKLLHIVEPDVAVFGRKDYQQAVLIRRMVSDLNLPVDVVVGPLVRERDGLALSSRNAYLSTHERAQAAALARALDAGHRAFAAGTRDAAAVLHVARAELAAAAVEIEYADLVDPETLRPVHEAQASSVVAVAGRVGATRLIDNAPVGAGPEADPRVE